MQDVIVVGAGPTGTLAARSMASKGYDVLVMENHKVPGLPQHCAGLITEETLKMTGVKPHIFGTFHGAEFIFPNGKSIIVRSDKVKALAVDRVDMDMKMAEAAARAGARFSYSTKYVSHTLKDCVYVDTENATYKARAIIGADGASSAVAMSMGENRPKEFVRGIQADIDMVMDDQDTFKVMVGNNVAPGFFAWQIPCGDFTRIGVCCSWEAGVPSDYLTQILIDKGVHNKVLRVFSGKIPLGGRPFLCGDRCLLTGDAAGFVKPLSGGGLYPGMKANEHLVKVLSNCLDSDTLTSKDLSEYTRECNNDFIKELNRSYGIRRKFKRLTDDGLNSIYDYIMKNDMVPALNDLDIDHPSDAMKVVMSSPKAVLSGIPIYLRTLR